MSDSIKVAIKVRPLIKRENDDNLPIQWAVQGNFIAPLDPEVKKRGEGFCFDHIFDTCQTNNDVFNTVAKPIVDATVNGFNGTIFAYGQTSSGKTFTMMGEPENPGVIPLAVDHIFDAIANTYGREFLLRVSYIEIYNERINDLLDKERTDLKIEVAKNGQMDVGCKEEVINCPESVLAIMKKGEKNRRTGETNMNERSSRSHTIFRITIESRETNSNSDGAVHVSQLNLVDLAGSERAGQTGATGERFNEGRHINRSLSALGLVIMQLSEMQENPQKFVNFRDSKLTRILQASLGGNAMTTIICAVTPAALEETQCTLAFASRAKRIKNQPHVNEVLSDAALLKRYAIQLAKLKAELEIAKSADVVEMESKLMEKDRANQVLEERIELLKTRIVGGNTSQDDEQFKKRANRRRTWAGVGTPQTKISPLQLAPGLPTIKEQNTPEKTKKKDLMKRRQSIIQSLDIPNLTFQTAFTDFELELIETERARLRLSDCSIESDYERTGVRRPKRNVQFMDDVAVFDTSFRSLERTPERKSGELESPGTPKNVLRTRMNFLMEQYNALTKDHRSLEEFTNLEKQLFVEEAVEKAMVERDKTIETLRQSLSDSEQARREIAEKYTKLQSHSTELDKRLAELEQKLAESANTLKALRSEKALLVEELKNFKESKNHRESETTCNSKIDKETSSIFANNTYFEDMNISDVPGNSILTNDTQNMEDLTTFDVSTSSNNTTVNKFDDSKRSKEITNAAYSEFMRQSGEKSRDELIRVIEELLSVKLSNEEEITKVEAALEQKIREADDVKSDVREFKMGIEKLQGTVHLLTNENTDLTSKLTSEKERAKEIEKNLQSTIDELNKNIQAIIKEKSELQNCLKENEEKWKILPITTNEDERKKLIDDYKKIIDSLTAENIEMSTNLMNKIEELDRLRDDKAPPGDHECAYRELTKNLSERNKLLEAENIELSSNLMDKIEEYDRLKEKHEILSDKSSLHRKSTNLIDISMNRTNLIDDEISYNVDSSRATIITNGQIKERSEKKAEIEKSEFSRPTVDDLLRMSIAPNNSAIENGEVIDDLLSLSVISDETEKCAKNHDESLETWKLKAQMLLEQVKNLTVLNDKLSNLKLTSCTQCAHLVELRESRKTLNKEVKTVNRKLQDLQTKFDRECANTEILRTKASEDLNLSICDLTLNGSFIEGGINVSYVEERVQILHNEVEALKSDHDKLSALYREKCDEIEKLRDGNVRETTPTSTTTSTTDSPRPRRNDVEFVRIETEMEELRNDLRKLKKSLSNVSAALQKFVNDKTLMQREIEELRNEKKNFEVKLMEIENSSLESEQIKALEKEIARLRSEIENSDSVKCHLEKVKSSLEAEVQSLESGKEKDEKKIERLEKEVVRLGREIENSNIVKLQMEEAKLTLEVQLKFLESDKEALEEILAKTEISSTAQQTIGQLQNEVSRLCSEIKNFNVVTHQLENAKSSLEAQVQSLIIEKEALEVRFSKNEDLSATQGQIKKLENEVHRLGSEIDDLNLVKCQLEDAKSSLESQVQLLKQEKEVSKGKLPEMEIFLMAQERIEQVESKVVCLNSEIETSNIVKCQLEEANSSLEVQLQLMKADKKALEEKLAKTENSSVAQQKIDQLESEVARLCSEIENFDVVKSQMENAKLSLEAQVQSLNIEREVLKERLSNNDDLSASQEKIEKLESEVARLSKEIENSNIVKSQLENAKLSLEAQVQSLNIEREVLKERLSNNDDLSVGQEKIEKLESEVACLSKEIENSNIVKSQLENAKLSLEAELQCMKTEKEAFRRKSAETELSSMAKEKIKQLENEIVRLCSEIENSNVVKNQLEDDKSSMEVQLQFLETDKEALEEKLAEMELSSTSQEKQLENEAACRSFEIENSKIYKCQRKSAKSSLQAEVQSLKTKEEMFEENSSECKDLSACHEKIASLENKLSCLSSEINNSNVLKKQQEDAKLSLEMEIDSLIIERNLRDQKINELQQSLQDLADNNLTLRLTLEKLSSEKDAAVEYSPNSDKTVDSSNNNFESFEKIIESLQARLKETTEMLEKFVIINGELNDRLVQVETTENELVATKLNLEEELTTITKTLESKVKDATNELNEYTKENVELKEKLDKLEKTSTDEKFALINEVTSLKSEITNLQNNLNSLNATIRELEENKSSLIVKLEESMNSKKNQPDPEFNESSYKTLKEHEKMVEELQEKLHEITKELQSTAKETIDMNNELTKLNAAKDELNVMRLALATEIDDLKIEKNNLQETLTDMRASLTELDEKNVSLTKELLSIKAEKENLVSREIIENSKLREKTIEDLNIREADLDRELERYSKENEELRLKIAQLEEKIVSSAKIGNEKIIDDAKNEKSIFKKNEENNEKNQEELESARKSITKEIISLKPSSNIDQLGEKSISELFIHFVTTIMSKEQEVMKDLTDRFEREKRKLVDNKRESIGAEKRAAAWAKELEADLERTQQDLTRQETKNTELSLKIEKLENLLKESNHENQMLNEKMKVLEVDFNTLQADLEKTPEIRQNLTASSTQEKERFISETIDTREMELSSKLRLVEKQYREKLEELTINLEHEKAQNFDLSNNLEGLEANERQLKNIIELKTNELAKCNSMIERLKNELEVMTESYNLSSRENLDKTRQINEITSLLKIKCDKLSEYKTKLESITPEYENLKDQSTERQLRLEKYKSEIECLTTENEKNLSSLKDRLITEEIKCVGYQKQLAELTNRDTSLQAEIIEIRLKCDELEISNEKLMKSMRNSTSKIRAEEEIEDLRDRNRILQRNLDGAGNRINELQETKTRLMKDLVDLRVEHEATCNENGQMKKIISSHRSSVTDTIELREKYEGVLQEKNRIAMELEEKKASIALMERRIDMSEREKEKLRETNKELDIEMDDIVVHINELKKENAELDDKLYGMSKSVDLQKIKIDELTTKNESLEALMMKYEEKIKKLKSQEETLRAEHEIAAKISETLANENAELRGKLSALDSLSCGESSRSSSPALESIRIDNRRRRSRNDLFNLNRPLEVLETNEEMKNCRCEALKQQISKLEKEVAMKNGKIATLELKMQSEIFPHMRKCKDLEEMLGSLRRKYQLSKVEIKKLEETRAQEMSSECKRCRQWETDKRDKSSQCMPHSEPIFMNGMSSGFLEDHMKMKKLEKDKDTLKNLCRNRQKRIFELEALLKTLDKDSINDETSVTIDLSIQATSSKLDVAPNTRQAMKENVPAIWDYRRHPSHVLRRDWFN